MLRNFNFLIIVKLNSSAFNIKFSSARGIKYAFSISPRLGLGTYKEQLAALYR